MIKARNQQKAGHEVLNQQSSINNPFATGKQAQDLKDRLYG
jgi:hypothetical protein